MNVMKLMFVLLLFLVASSVSWGQASVAGDWSGLVQGPGLHIVLHVSGRAGNYTATADSPDQGKNGIPATITADAGGNVTVAISTPSPFSYTGTLNGSTIDGTWSQGGQTGQLKLTKSDATSSSADGTTGVVGDWKGVVEGPGLHLVLHISGTAGSYTATTDSVDQAGGNGISTTVTVDGSSVTAEVATPSPFSYTGTLSGSTITGHWTQGGHTGPMTLTKAGVTGDVAGDKSSTIVGDWSGNVQPGLPITLHISESAGDYTGKDDLGNTLTISKAGDIVTIKIPTPSPFSYTGTLSGSTITGHWTQGGHTDSMTLTKAGN